MMQLRYAFPRENLMNSPTLNASALPPRPAYKDRRGWLIAFGVVEILIACCFLLMTLMVCVAAMAIPNMPKQPGQPEAPVGLVLIGAGFYGLVAAVFATVGIGSIQARNWARILAIVLSSLWLVFGVTGTLGFALMMPIMVHQQEAILSQNPAMQQGQLPPHFMTGLMTGMLIFGILAMVVLPLIFLIFYTRKSVKATCEGLWAPLSTAAAPGAMTALPTAVPAARRLPVPIVVAIVCFVLYGLSKLASMWLPMTILFGVTFHGAAARLILLALAAIDLYCAWSFFKLRIEGWWVAICAFVLFMASGITTLLRVDFRHVYDEVYRQMGMNPQQVSPYAVGFQPSSMHLLMATGWLVWAAFFVLLIYTKRYFSANHRA
jgi:hypothetical protein